MNTVILNPMPAGIGGNARKEQFIKVDGNSGKWLK